MSSARLFVIPALTHFYPFLKQERVNLCGVSFDGNLISNYRNRYNYTYILINHSIDGTRRTYIPGLTMALVVLAFSNSLNPFVTSIFVNHPIINIPAEGERGEGEEGGEKIFCFLGYTHEN